MRRMHVGVRATSTLIATLLLALPVAASSSPPPEARAAAPGVAFASVACPEAIEDYADCHAVRETQGAWVLVAMPREWNRRLVVHAHGGPRLGDPELAETLEDLARFAVMVREGYAWVGSSYRRGGYGVRVAAEDVERSRQLFVAQWGAPQRTLLHGQSWGGNVVAKLAELHALDDGGQPRYNAVFTTNGVLSGGTRAYGFRADLRAVYQHYCRNHPAPDEPGYPLWMGLPEGSSMDRAMLEDRVNACTGLDRSPGQRTEAQSAALRDILAVTGVREDTLVAHLAWGTFHFRDLVQRHLGGRNPFDNRQVRYRGSADDDALNAEVERFDADPVALARLGYDADLSGLIVLPTLTMHAAADPVVSPSAQNAYAAVVASAGRSALLAQVRTDESDHSRPGDVHVSAALRGLERWLDTGVAPDAAALQQDCLAQAPSPADCRFLALGPHEGGR